MPVYWTNGAPPPKAAVWVPPNCNVCVEAGPAVGVDNKDLFDSEADAHTVVRMFGQELLDKYVPLVWTAIWNKFQCPFGDRCKIRHPCGKTPTKPKYAEIGSDAVQDPAGNVKFRLYVCITRELECIPGEQQPADPKPEAPDYKKGREPQPGTPQPPASEMDGAEEVLLDRQEESLSAGPRKTSRQP